jgi:hypothetical protein
MSNHRWRLEDPVLGHVDHEYWYYLLAMGRRVLLSVHHAFLL